MIIHIVKPRERINDVLNYYSITFDDLKSNNMHITDFMNLIPGTRLKIPNISGEVAQVLNETEPLVSDYYTDKFEEPDINEIKEEVDNVPNENVTKPINYIRPKGVWGPNFRKSIYPFYKKPNNPK